MSFWLLKVCDRVKSLRPKCGLPASVFDLNETFTEFSPTVRIAVGGLINAADGAISWIKFLLSVASEGVFFCD